MINTPQSDLSKQNVALQHEYLSLKNQYRQSDDEASRKKLRKKIDANKEAFIKLNEALITWVLKNHAAPNSSSSLSNEDIRQEAALALLEARERWDPAKGALATWAPFIIRSALQKQGWSEDFSLVSKSAYLARGKFSSSVAKLYSTLGRLPTPSEVAKDADIPVSVAAQLLTAQKTLSLDAPKSPGDNDSTNIEIADTSPQTSGLPPEVFHIIEKLLRGYTASEVALITRSFGLDGSPPQNTTRTATTLLIPTKKALAIIHKFELALRQEIAPSSSELVSVS
jgi:DNA-directed RNA polymerase specialized sigma subunit